MTSKLYKHACVILLTILVCSPVANAQSLGYFKRIRTDRVTVTTPDNGGGTSPTMAITGAEIGYVEGDCQDAHGCAASISESGAREGQDLVLVQISASPGVITVSDSAGVVELQNGTAYAMAQYEALFLRYIGDRWIEVGRTESVSPVGAGLSFLTKVSEASLSNEFALGSLATGLLKNTTTTGVPTIAVAGTDYVAPGAITTSGLTQTTARILGRTTASTGAVEELTTVPVTLGGLGLSALCADDEVLVSSGAAYVCKAVPNCNTITEKLLYATATNTFSCQTDQTASGAGSGDVVGPASATDECFARFDTTTGKLIQDSVICASNAGLITFPDDIRQTFNPGTNAAGVNVGSQAADPGTPTNGDLWYQSTANELRARINGATVALGAGGGSGAVVQVVNTQTGALATGTTTIPIDDTIPQNTEGDEYMTLAITPTSATNRLQIHVSAVVAAGTAGRAVTTALFQDTTANALAATYMWLQTVNATMTLSLDHDMVAGTTSATTFKVRLGPNAAATLSFNGSAGVRLYGGVSASSISIMEYVP